MVIEEKITCIACTDFFYVVVTDKGEVYEWTVEFGGSSTIEKPRKKIELSGKTIGNLFLLKAYYKKSESIQINQGFVIYMTLMNNQIYSILVKVVCGSHHTLALTDKGEVYGWGASSCGQLNTSESISPPIMVNDLLLFVILIITVTTKTYNKENFSIDR